MLHATFHSVFDDVSSVAQSNNNNSLIILKFIRRAKSASLIWGLVVDNLYNATNVVKRNVLQCLGLLRRTSIFANVLTSARVGLCRNYAECIVSGRSLWFGGWKLHVRDGRVQDSILLAVGDDERFYMDSGRSFDRQVPYDNLLTE